MGSPSPSRRPWWFRQKRSPATSTEKRAVLRNALAIVRGNPSASSRFERAQERVSRRREELSRIRDDTPEGAAARKRLLDKYEWSVSRLLGVKLGRKILVQSTAGKQARWVAMEQALNTLGFPSSKSAQLFFEMQSMIQKVVIPSSYTGDLVQPYRAGRKNEDPAKLRREMVREARHFLGLIRARYFVSRFLSIYKDLTSK